MSEKYSARNYYLIDSVKGGCGKTTFAIMLTQYLEQKRKDGKIKNGICLLDMDFLGTGMRHLFLGESIPGGARGTIEELPADCIYLNRKIRNFNVVDKQYIQNIQVGAYEFHIGFSDPEYREKSEFRLSSKNNYVPGIQFGKFRAGIKEIFRKGELESQIKTLNGTVQNIILDMSPGSDTFSDSIKDCLLDRKHSQFIDESDTCRYFLMVGMDASHLVAAKNYLHNLYEGEDLIPDKVYIVFNDILQALHKCHTTVHYEARKKLIEDMLEDIPQKKLNNIRFLVLNSYNDYAAAVQDMVGICDARGKLFPDHPIRFYAEYGEELAEVEKDIEEKVFTCLWG